MNAPFKTLLPNVFYSATVYHSLGIAKTYLHQPLQ